MDDAYDIFWRSYISSWQPFTFIYRKREQLLFIAYDDCHILSTLYLEMLDFKMSKNLSRYIIVQL